MQGVLMMVLSPKLLLLLPLVAITTPAADSDNDFIQYKEDCDGVNANVHVGYDESEVIASDNRINFNVPNKTVMVFVAMVLSCNSGSVDMTIELQVSEAANKVS